MESGSRIYDGGDLWVTVVLLGVVMGVVGGCNNPPPPLVLPEQLNQSVSHPACQPCQGRSRPPRSEPREMCRLPPREPSPRRPRPRPPHWPAAVRRQEAGDRRQALPAAGCSRQSLTARRADNKHAPFSVLAPTQARTPDSNKMAPGLIGAAGQRRVLVAAGAGGLPRIPRATLVNQSISQIPFFSSLSIQTRSLNNLFYNSILQFFVPPDRSSVGTCAWCKDAN